MLNFKSNFMQKVTIIIIVLLTITGCKKTHCPEYPATLNYFPYSVGQELKFVDSQQNIQSFTIEHKNNSKAESFAWNCKCACGAHSISYTNENQDSLSLQFKVFIDGGYGSDVTAHSINVGCSFQYSYEYSDHLEKRIDFEKEVSYNEIYKYVNDTMSIEKEDGYIVKKAVIVKGKGLVSYTTIDGEEWKLVE